MSIIDDLLAKKGLKYENLTAVEKETYNTMADALNRSQLTPDKFKDYVASMRMSVETELCNEPEYKSIIFFKVRNDKNIFLKARLKNYLLIEAFLMTPEKAKRAIETAMAGMMK